MKPVVYSGLLSILYLVSLSFSQGKGGRWEFENNGLDTADWDMLENNGNLQNQASFSSESPVQQGTAYLWLDSSKVHDYFRIEDSNDLDFDNENLAMSAWIYPLVINDVHYILLKGRQDSFPKTTNYSMRILINKKLEFLIRDVNDQAQRVTSSFTISEGQWSFVAIFYDFSAGKVYMWNDPNTSPVDTLDFDQDFFSNGDPLSIGTWFRSDPNNPSIKDFEGKIDDVRISGRLEDVLPIATAIESRTPETDDNLPVKMDIYPNPVSLSQRQDGVNVQLQLLNHPEPVSIYIYNILGQQIFNATISNPYTGQIFRWSMRNHQGNLVETGLYFVKLEMDRHVYFTKKVVVIK